MERDEYEKILTLHGIKARRKMGEEPYVAPALVATPESGAVSAVRSETAPADAPHQHKPLAEITHETVVSESGEKTDAGKPSRKQKK
jgi:hypothetical protein